MKLYFKIAFLLLFIISNKTIAQTYNFETTDLSMSVKEGGKWSKFADPKEVKISVTFDSKKDRITIFSESTQFFKIINYLKKQNLKDRSIISFDCVNQEGTKCELAIHNIKKEKGSNQLYVYFKDIILIYNMKYVVSPIK